MLLIITGSNNFAQTCEQILFSKLEGIQWKLSCKGCDVEPHIILFLPDGELGEKGDYEENTEDDYWEISNETILLSYNNEYVIYSGKYKNGIIKGRAKNIVGKSWSWKAVPVK
jgi:hypothetical protein